MLVYDPLVQKRHSDGKITNCDARIYKSTYELFEDALKDGTLVVDLRSASCVRTTPLVNLAPHARSHPDPGAGCGGPNGLVLA